MLDLLKLKGVKPQKKLTCTRSVSTVNSLCSTPPEVWFTFQEEEDQNSTSFPVECGQILTLPTDSIVFGSPYIYANVYPTSSSYTYSWRINGAIQDTTDNRIAFDPLVIGEFVYEVTVTDINSGEETNCSFNFRIVDPDSPNLYISFLVITISNALYIGVLDGSTIYSYKRSGPQLFGNAIINQDPIIKEKLSIVSETETSTTYEFFIKDSNKRTATSQFTVQYPFEQLASVTVSKLIVDDTPVCCGGVFHKMQDVTSLCNNTAVALSGQITTNVYKHLTYTVKIDNEILGEGDVTFNGVTGTTDVYQLDILKRTTEAVVEFHDVCSGSDEPVEICRVTIEARTTNLSRTRNLSTEFLS